MPESLHNYYKGSPMTDVLDPISPAKKALKRKAQKRLDYIRERLKDLRAERGRLNEELTLLKEEVGKLRSA